MIRKCDPVSRESAEAVAVNALTFLTDDPAILARFLDVTGWSPASLAAPGSKGAILLAALDHLMSEEDLLLTFAANAGLEPQEVARAQRTLSGAGAAPRKAGA